jgi:hypothetical protein
MDRIELEGVEEVGELGEVGEVGEVGELGEVGEVGRRFLPITNHQSPITNYQSPTSLSSVNDDGVFFLGLHASGH